MTVSLPVTILLLAVPTAAPKPQAGCDLDSDTGRLCSLDVTMATELKALIDAVGTVRELRERAARAHATSATFVGVDGATLRFDERGRFVSWSGRGASQSFEWDGEDRLVTSSEVGRG